MSLYRDANRAAPGRVGRYELLRRIGVGGMGEVFLARERGVAGVDRLVVVKLMLEELAEQPEHVAHFIDEARIAAQLAHPNIVQVYEFGKDGGAYFMAMEYIAGQNLARICQRAAREKVPYPRPAAVHVVAEMVRGLDYAHNATDSRGRPMGIVHRDISPHNALISIGGDVKLLDFGIARATVRQQRTQTGMLRGKFGYMSPEQAEQAELDARSDVFCAGIVLWETTLMRRLFRGDTELETINKVVRAQVPAPRAIDPSYPAELEAVVMTALARDPDERFQSAGAMAAALRNVLRRHPPVEKEELGALVLRLFPETLPNDLDHVVRSTAPVPVAEPMPATVPAKGTPPKPRSRLPWILGATVLVTSVAVAIWLVRARDGAEARAPVVVDAASPTPATDAGLAAAPPESDAAIIADAAPPARRASHRRRHARRVDARVPRVSRSPVVPDAGVAQPAQPARPALGRIAVASTPYGRVTIDGKPYGPTDLVQSLPAGTYRVVVTMSDGSGTRAATITIRAGKKTKCQVAGNALRCQPPR